MECGIGSYTFNGQPIPQETLALYMMPNPRSLNKATRYSLIDFANIIADVNQKNKNPYKVILTNIQKYASRKIYLDFDFDINSDNLVSLMCVIKNNLNENCFNVIHTRGGIHLLVEVNKIEKQYKKTWYNAITSLPTCDVRGDMLLPVPGCCQGNFVPKFEGLVI